MVEQTIARSYKEALVILKELELLEKIPNNLLENMKIKQDEDWNFIYDRTLPLESQNILKDTAGILSVIFLNYICEDYEEKQDLKEIYMANDMYKQKEQLQEKEHEDSEKNSLVMNDEVSDSIGVVNVSVVPKLSVKDKIFRFLKNIFKI